MKTDFNYRRITYIQDNYRFYGIAGVKLSIKGKIKDIDYIEETIKCISKKELKRFIIALTESLKYPVIDLGKID